MEEIGVAGGDTAADGSGSGMTDSLSSTGSAASMNRSGAHIRDFGNLTDDYVGRLYAYRYSNTSVVLGTRSAEIDSTQGHYMSVGLSEAADEEYVCEVVNFPERELRGISTYSVTIQTNKCEYLSPLCLSNRR